MYNLAPCEHMEQYRNDLSNSSSDLEDDGGAAGDYLSEQEPPAVLLATAGYDHAIRFWDVVSGACTSTLQYNLSQVNCLAVTADKRILGAAGNPQVHIFDTTSAAGPIRVLDSTNHSHHHHHHQSSQPSASSNITSLDFHPSDPWLFTASDDGALRIWDLRAARCQSVLDNGPSINSAVLHPSRTEVIVTADQNGSVKCWDLRSSGCLSEMIPEESVPLRSISLSADGQLMAAANSKGRVYVWREEEGLDFSFVPTSKIQAHQTYITKCAFSPSGDYLATASADHTVALWQFASTDGNSIDDDDDEVDGNSIPSDVTDDALHLRHTFEGHLKWVWDCAFSADSAYLVSASSDNTARLWSISSGDCICIYTGHSKAITSVALNDVAL